MIGMLWKKRPEEASYGADGIHVTTQAKPTATL
jgi:hypothetical protein